MVVEKLVPCKARVETFSRVVGYYRPVQNWNVGKQQEFKDRLEFTEGKALKKDFKVV